MKKFKFFFPKMFLYTNLAYSSINAFNWDWVFWILGFRHNFIVYRYYSVKRTLQFGDHPVDFMKESKWSPARKHRVERNRDFFQRNFDGEWRFNGHQARRALIARGNFRLESLHNRVSSIQTKIAS
jgi:hypothetical protein